MSDIDAIRQRDADSAETWFKEPPLGACGRAFIDRRWLLAEVDRQRGTLSLAEEGLANYAQEVEQLREAFRRLRLGICLHATDTVWAGPAETAVDFITRHLADEWTEGSSSEPQSAEHSSSAVDKA